MKFRPASVFTLRCRLLGGARRFGAHWGGEGRGHVVAAARLQLVLFYAMSKYYDKLLLNLTSRLSLVLGLWLFSNAGFIFLERLL